MLELFKFFKFLNFLNPYLTGHDDCNTVRLACVYIIVEINFQLISLAQV